MFSEKRKCLIKQFNFRLNGDKKIFPVKTPNELISFVELE